MPRKGKKHGNRKARQVGWREDDSPRHQLVRTCAGANSCMVDVKDGKMLRIRPARYYEQVHQGRSEALGDARPGQDLRAQREEPHPPAQPRLQEAGLLPGPHPLPHEARGLRSQGPVERAIIQNRGVSKYERISWDEALDIIVERDAAGQGEVRAHRHPLPVRPARREQGGARPARLRAQAAAGCWAATRCRCATPTAGKAGPGAQSTCGACEPVGQQVPQSNLLYDISKNAELLLFWGCDQETTTWGWQGQLPSRLSYWWTELGIQQIYIAPDCNYANAVHADKWIPILPNTDAALYLAIAYQWFKNGTYDKEYLETHAYGRGQVRGLRHGRARTACPRPPSGPRPSPACRPASSRRWPTSGPPSAPRWSSATAARHPRPLRSRAGPSAGALPGHAGPGQAGLQPGEDDRVGPHRRHRADVAARSPRCCSASVPAYTGGSVHGHQPSLVHPQDSRPQGHPRG